MIVIDNVTDLTKLTGVDIEMAITELDEAQHTPHSDIPVEDVPYGDSDAKETDDDEDKLEVTYGDGDIGAGLQEKA